jgi:hypothetical protein
MARWRWLLSAALAASAISCVATVQAEKENKDEGPVPIDEIPAPARDAIRRHVGVGSLLGVVEETGQRGEPVYVASISHGTCHLTIRVDAAGNILELHRGE